MRKRSKYILSGIAAIILGWLGAGFGYSVKLGPHPINTICFLGGIVLFILGTIIFIIGIISLVAGGITSLKPKK